MSLEASGTNEQLAAVKPAEGLIAQVKGVLLQRISKAVGGLGWTGSIDQLLPGKMLRTRLAQRLTENFRQTGFSPLPRLCAAVELVHTASLCHDDLIDNAQIRRGKETLWLATSASGAVLLGDLLLCEAMELLLETSGGRYTEPFLAKVRQVIDAEAQQELCLRGQWTDEQTKLRVAREKTGPLFAFVAWACGGQDEALSAALEEAGYRVGAAYQLADDILDMTGSEQEAGKTLGSDLRRGKHTLPHDGEHALNLTQKRIGQLCDSALACLEPYPQARLGLLRYLQLDLRSLLHRWAGGPA